MNENRRFRREWLEQELIIVIDMYYNFLKKDSHGYDAVARCMGRYNPAKARHDGAINEKIAEIKGYVERSRKERHPGAALFQLVDQYRNNLIVLRRAAKAAWQSILHDYGGPVPAEVRQYVS